MATMKTGEGAPPPPKLVEDSFDVEWEGTLAREPYDVELWLEYAQDKTRRGLSPAAVAMVFERALSRLPGSYKIWRAYLQARRSWINECPATPGLPVVADLNATFERCLLFMSKMPRIWLMYCEFLVEQRALIKARETFDRALSVLPLTQHGLIWDAYSSFVLTVPQIPWQTAERVLKRRCMIDPDEGRAALVALLKSRERHGEAARELNDMLHSTKDEDIRKQIRRELVALVRAHPEGCQDFCDLEAVCRTIPSNDHEERVKVFIGLADYYIRLGSFDQAREVFEALMKKECDESIRDFSTVFETYSKFEEAVLDDCEEQMQTAEGDSDKQELREETGFRIKRLHRLLDRRAAMAGKIFLKAWPGDVQERLAQARFFEKKMDYATVESAILEAFPENEPLELLNGRGSSLFLWLAEAIAKRLEKTGKEGDEIVKAQDRALALGCRRCWDLRDVVDLWRARIELHIDNDQPERALRLAKEALTPPPSSSSAGEEEMTDSVNKKKIHRRPFPHRSQVLWSLYLDLEESHGTLESARAAYEEAMEIRVCSVWNVLNFCKLLRKHNYHEDSYVVFERALAMFPWPHAKDLWIEYTKQFVERYGSSKVERARDMFEQCIQTLPESAREHAEAIFFAYAKFEETHGLSRRAMGIYERWSGFVPDHQKLDAHLLWASKAEEFFGPSAARKVYERAMGVLPELDIARISVRFAALEKRLGEYERARAVFKHGSQFTDPRDGRKDVGLWQAWNEFEVKFGNEETFKEMLRVKRSVEAHYGILHAVDNIVVPQKLQQAPQASQNTAITLSDANPSPTFTPDVQNAAVDDNEIDIDDDDGGEKEETSEPNQTVDTATRMGALERLKAAAATARAAKQS